MRVYPAQYYYMEMNTARMLKELNINYDEPDDLIRRRIDKLEEETESTLDEQQKRAVAEAVSMGYSS